VVVDDDGVNSVIGVTVGDFGGVVVDGVMSVSVGVVSVVVIVGVVAVVGVCVFVDSVVVTLLMLLLVVVLVLSLCMLGVVCTYVMVRVASVGYIGTVGVDGVGVGCVTDGVTFIVIG